MSKQRRLKDVAAARNRYHKHTRIYSQAQLRQHELSWLLYITEGYRANVAHALAVNAYTLTRADLQIVHQTLRQAEDIANGLRESMGSEVQERSSRKLRLLK
jgi:hypothetical protein